MPKFPSFPTLYEECKTISISFLKQHKYLTPGTWKSGAITWSRGEGPYKRITGSISVLIDAHPENPSLELDYKLDGKPINYKVQLLKVPSNIGKGVVWFFICPVTGKRCRKLYLVHTYFLHREAFRGCFYEKQTYSHKNRILNRSLEHLFGTDKVYEQIYSKHFKKQYAGKQQNGL